MDTSPEPKKLPSKPSLEHLQKQAKQRVKQDPSLQLATAQHKIAQEYGFKNWAELAKAVETMAGSPTSGSAETSKSNLPELSMGADSYAGRYPLAIGRHPGGPMQAIEITEYKGGLRAQRPGLPPVNLQTIGNDMFALVGSTEEISFERDATGKVVALKWVRRCLRQPLPQPPPAVELPAGDLLEYSGRYAVTLAFIVEVRADRNKLFVQIGRRSKLGSQRSGSLPSRLRAIGPDRFIMAGFMAGSANEFSFERDAIGKVVALKWTRHCLRQPLPPPPAPAKVELPAEELREYSGRYAITPTFIIEVRVDGNELLVQIGERPELRAFAFAKDKFFIGSMNAKIHFRRDGAGQVSGIAVEQKGHNMAGTKYSK